MAEAVAEQSSNTKFFCYKCNDEIPRVLDDFTCPICKGGFIEEVHEPPSRGEPESAGSSTSNTTSFNIGTGSGLDFLQLLRGLSDPSGSGGSGGQSVRFHTGPAQANFQRTRSEGSAGASPGGFSFVVGPTQGRGSAGRSNPNLDNPMEHVLFTFLNDLIHGLGGGAAGGAGGGATPLLSNFGDYAWGHDGLDSIVTQLMNQMEGTGPPPLATDRIDTLPDVTICQEQVERKLQCSVCWDDFSVGEVVKKLECDHVYHPDCIIPWLKLHGTCPICRKDLTGQVQEGAKNTPSARFEPMLVDDSPIINSPETTSSSSNVNTGSSNDSACPSDFPSVANAATSGRNYSSSSSTSSPIPRPLVQSISQILDPLLSGLSGSGTSNNASNNQPTSGAGRQGTGQQQPPNTGDRHGRGRGRGRGFDNMDLEFD